MGRARFGGRCWLLAGMLTLAAFLLAPVTVAQAATITVNSNLDGAPANDLQCTLREAILNARSNNGLNTDCAAGEAGPAIDTIQFNIGGGGAQTISPGSALPTIFGGPVVLDATTQPGFAALPLITLDGVGAGAGTSGLAPTGPDVTIRGFAIVRFDASGILLNAGVQQTVIQGNHIGVDRAAQTAQGNGIGISAPSAFSTTIGGASANQRNVISGNGGDGVALAGSNAATIQGNFIGTNVDGTLARGNGGDGVDAGPTAFTLLVGGTTSGAGNLISGNAQRGIFVHGANVRLTAQGNRIGTNLAGTSAIPNQDDGVRIEANLATIGGTASGAGNLISGNLFNGIAAVQAGEQTIQGNLIGLNAAGTAALANGRSGIRLDSSRGTIGGETAAARNIISGNGESGISTENQVSNISIDGNYIGTNAAGTAAVPNQQHGIAMTGTNHGIGGNTPAGGNLISGNLLTGIVFTNAQLVDVRNNLIGTDLTGALPIPNGNVGISVVNSNRIEIGDVETAGRGNTIAFNAAGIAVSATSDRIGIVDNRIFSNAGQGIGLVPPDGVDANDAGDGDGGGNTGQNYPVVTGAASGGALFVSGTLNTTPNTNGIRIQIFGSAACDPSGNGEGERFLGEVTVNTDASGNAAWSAPSLPAVAVGTFITTTASSPTGSSLNTSELSTCRAVVGAGSGSISVSPAQIATTEAGGQGNITVVLGSAPQTDVTIPFTSSDLTEGTVSPNQLAFTSANFNVPQIVTVTGVDDAIVDGNVSYTIVTGPAVSTDPAFSGVNPVDVPATNEDNDVAVISVAPAQIVTTEAGGKADITVVLRAAPQANVTIPLSSSNIAEGALSANQLVFTPANFNVPQIVTVTGVDDLLVDGTVAYTIVTGPAVSTDTAFSGVNPADVAATNQDNDTAGISVSPAQIVTTEAGGQAAITVALTGQPNANVAIPIASSDLTEGTLAVNQLVFTSANFNVPQVVTVSGVDDLLVDGTVAYTIVTGPAVSTDPAFNGINPADVAATNQDNDTALVSVTPAQVSTSEIGTKAAITVVLGGQPQATVTIPVRSSDLTEGAVSPTQLVFTPANFNLPQMVTVTGVDDDLLDGPIAYTIELGLTVSTDPPFDGLNPADVAATNADNDLPPSPANNDGQGESGKPRNERKDDVRESEAQRLQRERTNRSGSDDYRTEGNVTAVDLEASPRTATIATRDGFQVIVLLCRDSCDDPRVGDYLEAEGVKENEALFYADNVTSERPGR